MSFTDGAFLIYLLVFMLVWPLLRWHDQTRWIGLTLASLLFYGWWDWRFLFLLLGSGAIDYLTALLLERYPQQRRSWLAVSIITNIGLLAGFKYLGFGVDTLALVFDIPPQQRSWSHSVILPVGISFYTFQSLSYTIDVYRGQLRALRNPWHFFAYLSMFPQLVAGPIVRATDLIPQLATPGHFNPDNRWWGLRIAAWGYMKKVVVADNLALIVNDAFSSSPELGLGWWLIAVLFAMQIYCDFSGYSDIACGIARWMGYQFPQNFNHPYAAAGPREFWSRWHITLSTWFRDYIYIPLGGSRHGGARTIANQLFTMVVSGLWHGANWTFVAWGAYHGTLLVMERLVRGGGTHYRGWLRVPVVCITFLVVLVGWVLFRAESIGQAGAIVWQMFSRTSGSFGSIELPSLWVAILILAIGAAHHLAVARFGLPHLARWPVPVQFVAVFIALLASVFLRGPGSEFIYFQF